MLVQKIKKKKDPTSKELASCSDLEDNGFLLVDARSALLVDAFAQIRLWLFYSGLGKENYEPFTHTFFCLPKKKYAKKRAPRAQTLHRAPILRATAF